MAKQWLNLGKLLFEEEQSDVSQEQVEQFLASQQSQVNVDVDAKALEGLIEIADIYEKAGLQDQTKSIFKVDEFSKALPESLPSEAKKTSVIGILAASNLSVDLLKADAEQRIGAINSVLEQFSNQTIDIVNSSQEEITQFEARIDELKVLINDRKILQEKQEKIANDEIEKVENIIKFLG